MAHIIDSPVQLGVDDQCKLHVFAKNSSRNRLESVYSLNGNGGQISLPFSEELTFSRAQSLTGQSLKIDDEFAIDVGMAIYRRNKIEGVLFVQTHVGAMPLDALKAMPPYVSLAGTLLPDPSDRSRGVVDLIRGAKLKQVRILGKDHGVEYGRLKALAGIFREIGYQPLLVKEHGEIPEMSNEEKVRVFADHARFVILENSFPGTRGTRALPPTVGNHLP